MPTLKKFVPGGSCCGGICDSYTYSSGDFSNWTAQSGTWSNVPGTVNSNAILTKNNTPTASYNWRYGVSSPHASYRSYWAWQSSTDHWYGEVLNALSGSVSVNLVEVVGGTPTTHLAITGLLAVNGLSVCYQNGFITVGVFSPNTVLGHVEVGEIDLGTIGVGSVSAPLTQFTNITLQYNTAGIRICAECLNSACCGDFEFPATVTITLSGLQSPYDVWNGAYVLPWTGGLNTCSWHKNNALANLGGGFTTNVITATRSTRESGDSYWTFGLQYQPTSGDNVVYRVEPIFYPIDYSVDWTISPCHDQWNTEPTDLTKIVGSNPHVTEGTVDIEGDF